MIASCQKETKQEQIQKQISGTWERTSLHGANPADGYDTHTITFSQSNGEFYYVKTYGGIPIDGASGSYTVNPSGTVDLSNGFQFHFDAENKLIQSGITYVYGYGDPHWQKK